MDLEYKMLKEINEMHKLIHHIVRQSTKSLLEGMDLLQIGRSQRESG